VPPQEGSCSQASFYSPSPCVSRSSSASGDRRGGGTQASGHTCSASRTAPPVDRDRRACRTGRRLAPPAVAPACRARLRGTRGDGHPERVAHERGWQSGRIPLCACAGPSRTPIPEQAERPFRRKPNAWVFGFARNACSTRPEYALCARDVLGGIRGGKCG
jgi:hypothetical protein